MLYILLIQKFQFVTDKINLNEIYYSLKYLEVQNLERNVINLSTRNLKLHEISINYVEGDGQFFVASPHVKNGLLSSSK